MAATLTIEEKQDYAWVDKWMIMGGAERQKFTADQWKDHFFKLSKALTYMLRHGAREQGLKVDPDASVDLDELLEHKNFKNKFTEAEIRVCVQTNAKKRFEIIGEGCNERIRATQGHSTRLGVEAAENLYTPVTPDTIPKLCIHGTFKKNVEPIRKEGLKTMGRVHIHMATGLPSDGSVVSGCREGANIFLYIDVAAAIKDKIEFLRSGNDVILTPGINGVLPPKYIIGATDGNGRLMFGKLPPNRNVPSGYVPGMDPGAASSSSRPEPVKQAEPEKPPSQLLVSEKNFLKDAKKLRDIIKLEAQKAEGKQIDKSQEMKITKKKEVLDELAISAEALPEDSQLREKNGDIFELLLEARP